MAEIWELTVAEAGSLLRKKLLSPVEYVTGLLARIEDIDPQLNAFIHISSDVALREAEIAAAEIQAGRWRGPMHGVPYGLKDIIDYAGMPTTAHSKLLMDNIAATDAAVTRQLRDAGAVCLGKLATHEFAIGGPSFDLPWPPARNPWNREHHPGGSSSGSGAAVAAGLVPAALGTDTGGSVRNPASMCGIVGMKPTYDLVSRAGVIPLSFTLDHVGPLTRTVEDNALLLSTIADRRLRGSANGSPYTPSFTAELNAGVAGLRIGYVRHFHEHDSSEASSEMVASLDSAVDVLRQQGAEIRDVRMRPLHEYASVQRVIQTAEAYSIHETWLRERPQDYGELSRQRLLAGAFISGADYVSALRERGLMVREFGETMGQLDAVICASSMEPAVEIVDVEEVRRTYRRQARMVFNLLGNPAIAIPSGFSTRQMPLAMQIVGKPWGEARILRIAQAYERATGWHDARPKVARAG